MLLKSKLIYFLFFVFVFAACKKEEATGIGFTFKNYSGHKVEVTGFSFNTDPTLIEKDSPIQNYEEIRGFASAISNPPINKSQITVVFDDSIIVAHADSLELAKDLRFMESYLGGEVPTDKDWLKLFEFEYVFTEADYEEALSHQ
jgi:hypothetical protein